MIKKCVWSFSTRPLDRPNINRVNSKEDFLYLFAMSWAINKQWFEKTELVTDRLGYDLLTSMGLDFNTVIICLDNIPHKYDNLFAYGKLMAYELQQEPFIHIDYDLFWHKRPPRRVLTSPICVQNIEDGETFRLGYSGGLKFIKKQKIKTPSYWDEKTKKSYNCGFFACNDLHFLKQYVQESKKVADLLLSIKERDICNDIFYEQLVLALFSKSKRKKIDFLFKEMSVDFDEAAFPDMNRWGYQHLVSVHKKSTHEMKKVKEFMKKNYPQICRNIKKTIEEYNLY